MRYPLALIPILLAALGGDVRPTLPVPGGPPENGWFGNPSDTGERVSGVLLRLGSGQPSLTCPMPVERPDTEAMAAMPVSRSSAIALAMPPAGNAEGGIGMPIARSGCWNPLDTSRLDSAALRVDRVLHPR